MEELFAPLGFLNKLKHTEWQRLQQVGHSNSFKKNSYIFRADDLNDSIYILLNGRIKITRLSQQGRELIQWFCLPGEIFGLSEDRKNHQRGLYAQAITEVKLLCIQKDDFNQFILQHPETGLLIIKQLASRLRSVGDMLSNVTSDGAHVRIIKLLQRLSESYGRTTDSKIYIDIYLTHQEMADMIGVCRQTVSSMVGVLKKQGIINTTRTGIFIQSPVVLQQLSEQTDIYFQHFTKSQAKH